MRQTTRDQRLELTLAAIGLALAMSACGSKTGLSVPDAGPDGGADAALPDGALPDGGFDGGPDSGPPPVPCIEVPIDGGDVDLPLEIEAQLVAADVFFLVDLTASMGDEIEEIRRGLRDQISPRINAAIPDSAIGVGAFEDFPEGTCGARGDVPFELILPMTQDLDRVQAAVDQLRLGNGGDLPESQVEALYQTATGEGLGRYIPPSTGCPGGGFGYPCFRTDGLPIVLLFTDAAFHNGPGGTHPYTACAPRGITPPPHHYADAVRVLQRLGIRVIPMYSGDGTGREDSVAIARDTGAFDRDGRPLIFDIGQRGERLNTSVIDAIETLADVIELDVETELVDPRPDEEPDPRDFIEAVVPTSATPMSNVRSIDLETGMFLGVRSGTLLLYRLRIRPGSVIPGPRARRVPLTIIFRGNGRPLDTRTVDLLIPGEDGGTCDDVP